MEKRRYVLKLAFLGGMFDGYARQRSGRTVEGEVIAALAKAKVARDAPTGKFASAARVDKGVSAIAAAVAVTTVAPRDRILSSLNANARSITFHSMAEVHLDFDPRRQANSRWYRYHFKDAGLEHGLDLPRMREASRIFLGEHDFSAFARADGRNPMREVQKIRIERRKGFVVLDVWGRSFLWNQVRRMATSLAKVGAGEARASDIQDALEGSGRRPFPTAPPEGLFLVDVVFKGLAFERPFGYPAGAVSGLRGAHHGARCDVLFHEYLRELVPF